MGAIASPVATGLGVISSFAGSAIPVLNTVNQLYGAVQSFGANSAQAQQELALQQLRAQQGLQQQQLAAQTALDREQIAANAAAAENDRRAALRRAVARQKAQYGASGITSAGGSSEAVLLGLFDESQEDLAERERLDSLRNAALDLGVSNAQSLNVLQRTQLQQRQNLDNQLSSYNSLF